MTGNRIRVHRAISLNRHCSKTALRDECNQGVRTEHMLMDAQTPKNIENGKQLVIAKMKLQPTCLRKLGPFFSMKLSMKKLQFSGLMGTPICHPELSIHQDASVSFVLFTKVWKPKCQCRTDVRRYQKWYYNQSWGNGYDAALLPTTEPAESITPADVLAGLRTLCFARWPLLGSKCGFQEFLPQHFLMKYLLDLLRHYSFHSFRSLDLLCTFYSFSVLGRN